MRASSWQLSFLQTTYNKPQLALQSKCLMSLLNSGSRISRVRPWHSARAQGWHTMFGALVVGGGNTSILDKVCFSGSNLLMPLSALQSKRGSVMQQAVKPFFRFLLKHLSQTLYCKSEGKPVNFRLLRCFLWSLVFQGWSPDHCGVAENRWRVCF